jgi:predicted LPLAT superfamily acyltransferase
MRLDIYIDDCCETCDHARQIAEQVRERMPQVEVNLIELTGDKPESVFAVPTYLLDGATLFLGNPSEVELFERLETRLL